MANAVICDGARVTEDVVALSEMRLPACLLDSPVAPVRPLATYALAGLSLLAWGSPSSMALRVGTAVLVLLTSSAKVTLST